MSEVLDFEIIVRSPAGSRVLTVLDIVRSIEAEGHDAQTGLQQLGFVIRRGLYYKDNPPPPVREVATAGGNDGPTAA